MPEPKPQLRSVAELIEHAELGDAAKTRVRPDATPSAFMRELVGEGLMVDAVRFLAQAIGPARAVALVFAMGFNPCGLAQATLGSRLRPLEPQRRNLLPWRCHGGP